MKELISLAFFNRSSYLQLVVYVRNLRLKAHTADCAVNSIKEFLNWVKTVKKQ